MQAGVYGRRRWRGMASVSLSSLLMLVTGLVVLQSVGGEKSGFEWSGVWAQAAGVARSQFGEDVPSLLQSIASRFGSFSSSPPPPPPHQHFDESVIPPQGSTEGDSPVLGEEDDDSNFGAGWEEDTANDEEMMELHLDAATGSFGVPSEDGFSLDGDDEAEEISGDFHTKFHGSDESEISKVRAKDSVSELKTTTSSEFEIEDEDEDEPQKPVPPPPPPPLSRRPPARSPSKPSSLPPQAKPQTRLQPNHGEDEGADRHIVDDAKHPPIVVLVHDRAAALRRLFQSLTEAKDIDISLVTVYQDGPDRSVEIVVRDYFPAKHIRLPRYLGAKGEPVLSTKLTFNYRFMMEHALANNQWAGHIIVLEDDLIVSPDVILFFKKAAQLMDEDPSIFCASGYNDNGFESNTGDWNRVLRGQHFMALGWMLSRRIFDETKDFWKMNEIWDVAFAIGMSQDRDGFIRECIFPEVARTKHIGDLTTRSGLTTSAAAQQSWFDFIFLHEGKGTVSMEAMQSARASTYEEIMKQMIKMGRPVSCLADMLSDTEMPLLFLFQAAADQHHQDEAWDDIATTFGLLGRGGGWDRLPRGFHHGVVQSRVGGNLILFISSTSPYVQEIAKLKTLLPFPPAPRNKEELMDSGRCPNAESILSTQMRSWRVFSGAASCSDLCHGVGLGCKAAKLWAAVADESCVMLQQVLGQVQSRFTCAGGCETEAAGLYTPVMDEDQTCKIPGANAMSCYQMETEPFAYKACPCIN